MQENGTVTVDVRQPLAYQYEHVVGAVNIPLDQMETSAADMLPDKDQTIILYCDYGGLSKQAAELLGGMGCTHLVEFDGMEVWKGETVLDESIE